MFDGPNNAQEERWVVRHFDKILVVGFIVFLAAGAVIGGTIGVLAENYQEKLQLEKTEQETR